MSRTIGKKWPKSAPRGDAPAVCDYCSAVWRRSQLVRDRAGRLACPWDAKGRDEATLSFLNAQGAAHRDLTSGAPSDGIQMPRESPAVPVPGPTFGAWVPVIQR